MKLSDIERAASDGRAAIDTIADKRRTWILVLAGVAAAFLIGFVLGAILF